VTIAQVPIRRRRAVAGFGAQDTFGADFGAQQVDLLAAAAHQPTGAWRGDRDPWREHDRRIVQLWSRQVGEDVRGLRQLQVEFIARGGVRLRSFRGDRERRVELQHVAAGELRVDRGRRFVSTLRVGFTHEWAWTIACSCSPTLEQLVGFVKNASGAPPPPSCSAGPPKKVSEIPSIFFSANVGRGIAGTVMRTR
jgi:hypothetical protein